MDAYHKIQEIINNFLESGGWIVLLILLVILVFFPHLGSKKNDNDSHPDSASK